MKSLLAIDIGNTNVKSAIFKGKKITKQFNLPVKTYSKNNFAKKLASNHLISDIVICSVVPNLTRIIKHDLKLLTGKSPFIIGKNLFVPMKNSYQKPKLLGQDRLVNAFAASKIYPTPAIVIDSGSAITFDIISKNKTYLGGLIFPGFETSLKALKKNTSLLPLIKLTQPKSLIGLNTKDCILNGIVFGTAALSKEIVNKIKQFIGKEATVIGTGGSISFIKKYSRIKIKVDKNLTLKGIKLAYESKY